VGIGRKVSEYLPFCQSPPIKKGDKPWVLSPFLVKTGLGIKIEHQGNENGNNNLKRE
jgi:hypothetical protein